jgi:predicted transposase/invertase (TIGR01784 family)
LLYFIPDNIKTPLSHGKTVFKTIETKETIDLHLASLGGQIFDLNILPEYFLITVPMFNNVIKQEIDEWLYVMKNSDTKENFKSPYMKKVKDRLSVLKMDPVEKDAYYTYIKEVITQRDAINAAEVKGEIKGRTEGKIEGKIEGKAEGFIEVAKKMLAEGADLNFISRITNLNLEEINKIKQEIK